MSIVEVLIYFVIFGFIPVLIKVHQIRSRGRERALAALRHQQLLDARRGTK